MRFAATINRAMRCLIVLCFWASPLVVLNSAAGWAQEVSPDLRSAILTGADLERSQKWLDAIEHYEKKLKGWPENNALKYGLRRSKIHFGIERRYADASFENQLLRMTGSAALDRYERISLPNPGELCGAGELHLVRGPWHREFLPCAQ